MGMPAAKQEDKIVGVDIDIVMIPNPTGQTPTPTSPHVQWNYRRESQ
jgi:hypothetical protein